MLAWIATGGLALLAVNSALFGLFPSDSSVRTSGPAFWYYRIGNAAFGLAFTIVFASAAVWVWRRTRHCRHRRARATGAVRDSGSSPTITAPPSRRARGTAVSAAVLALMLSLYLAAAGIYIELTRLVAGNSFVLLMVVAFALLYGFGAVLLLHRKPGGRRIILAMTGFLTILSMGGAVGTRGGELVGNLAALVFLALILVLAWVKPTREWVGLP